MRYIVFSTFLAAQVWLVSFETRLNTQAGYHYTDSYHYANPQTLASGQAAVGIIPAVEPYLVATEAAALVGDIGLLLPPAPPSPW